IILLFGYVFYKRGQLGMGDVLLFVAIQQLLPLTPIALKILNPVSFEFPDVSALPEVSWVIVGYVNVFTHALFFISLFLISSFLATIGSSFQYAMALAKSKKRLRPSPLYGIASLLLLAFGSYFLYLMFGLSILSGLFFILFLASGFFLTFRDQILDEIVVMDIPLSQIEDEDILAIEKIPREIVKKYGLEKVLTVSQVRNLKEVQKKEGMKLFPVNKILPRFGPYIFMALVLILLLGNVIEMILFLGSN
ncbi:MAG: hypothetical protein ABH863_05490, partial [Candidatus Micrarchaeota archaeon]